MNPFSRRDFLKKAGVGTEALGWNFNPDSVGPAGAAQQTKPLGYVVIGIGQLTKHEVIPAFKTTTHSRLTGLVSGDREKALRFAHQYGVPEKNIYNYDNYDGMASNHEIDAVYIGACPTVCTPNTPSGQHRPASMCFVRSSWPTLSANVRK